ncbi:MAG: 30S ribosome-binding factor RbfA [Candidatus Neomarinimicrobiota bacterium]
MRFRPYTRSDRFGHELKRIVSEIILKEVQANHLDLITVTHVKVSSDLKHAKVYVSVLNRNIPKSDVESFFSDRAKYIRRIVGGKIVAKSVPELRFYYDDTYEEVERIDRILAEIEKDRSGP